MATLGLSLNCPFHRHLFYLLWFWSVLDWDLLHPTNPFSLCIIGSIQRWFCPEMWCFRWRSWQGMSKQDGPKWSSHMSVAQSMSGQWLLFFVHVVHHRHQNQHLLNLLLKLLELSYAFVAFPPKIFFTAWISKQELCFVCVCITGSFSRCWCIWG